MSSLFQKLKSWFVPVGIEEVRGQLDHTLEVNMYRGKTFLDSEQVNYSYGSLQDVFDHAFIKTDLYDQSISTCLILGFGSGSVADLLLKKCNPKMVITGIEADIEVIRLAKKHFPISTSESVTIIHDTANDFAEQDRNTYDLIVIDVFIEDVVPETCQSREFLVHIKKLLAPSGKIYFNMMDIATELTQQGELAKRMKSVFGSVIDIPVHRGGAGNHVYVAR